MGSSRNIADENLKQDDLDINQRKLVFEREHARSRSKKWSLDFFSPSREGH